MTNHAHKFDDQGLCPCGASDRPGAAVTEVPSRGRGTEANRERAREIEQAAQAIRDADPKGIEVYDTAGLVSAIARALDAAEERGGDAERGAIAEDVLRFGLAAEFCCVNGAAMLDKLREGIKDRGAVPMVVPADVRERAELYALAVARSGAPDEATRRRMDAMPEAQRRRGIKRTVDELLTALGIAP